MKYMKLIVVSLITLVTMIIIGWQGHQQLYTFQDFSINPTTGSTNLFDDIEITGSSQEFKSRQGFSYLNGDIIHTDNYNYFDRLDSILGDQSRNTDILKQDYPELFRGYYDYQVENEKYFITINLPIFDIDVFDYANAPINVTILDKKAKTVSEHTLLRTIDNNQYNYFDVMGINYDGETLTIATNNSYVEKYTSGYEDDYQHDEQFYIHRYDLSTDKLISSTQSDFFENT